MKKIFLPFLLFAFFSFEIFAQCSNTILFQNFDNNTVANPPAGWIIQNVDFGNGNVSFPAYSGINRLGMNDVQDSIISKSVYCPGNVQFYWRASGASSNWSVHIQVSQNLINWTSIDSVVTNGSGSSTTYTLKSIPINTANLQAPFGTYIRWNMVRRVSGTFYLDDVCISGGTCSVTPTKLVFTQSPSNCIPSNIPFICRVCATDANGFIDSNFTTPISLSLASGSGTLGGTLTAPPSNGCAQFSGVTFSGVAPLSIIANAGALSTPQPLNNLDIKSTCPNEDTLKVVTYNLLNFPNGGVYSLGGACTPQELGPARWDTLKAIMDYILPDIMIVQELQTEAGADSVLNRAMNVSGRNYYARAPYIPNQSTANVNYNNECFYNTNKLTLYQTTTIPTSIRDVGVYKFYCKDPLLNVHNDTTFIDIYSIHTKARGLGAAQATLDSIQRATDCARVMDSIRARQSSERNAIIGGDMNLYTSNEGAYIAFTTGLYKFNDPVNTPGNWESDSTYSHLHTQAVRSSTDLSLECGAKGGLDSRLDFLLASDPIMDNTNRVSYISNTYNAVGNNGNLFNKAVNHPSNLSAPANVLRSMWNMSDHLPVEMKLRVRYPLLTPLSQQTEIKLYAQQYNNQIQLQWNMNNNLSLEKYIITRINTKTGDVHNIELSNINELFYTDYLINAATYNYYITAYYSNGSIIKSNTISVHLNTDQSIQVYPNPASTTLNLFLPKQKVSAYSIKLIGTDGTCTHNLKNVIANNDLVKIDITSLVSSVYALIITDDYGNIVYKTKFIKTN